MRRDLSSGGAVAALLLLPLLSCGPSAAGPWQEEAGVRWRELAGSGKGSAGFTTLAAARTGIAFRNDVSDSAAYRNRHLMHGSGVAVGDVDGDGLPDVYLARIEGPSALYRNLGGWRFEEIAARAGVALGDRPATGAMLGDLDGDRDLDLVVLSMGGGTALFENDGAGRFTEISRRAGVAEDPRGSTTAAAADVDGDGDLDLYISNYKTRNMLDSLSPQQRAFDQIVKKVGDGYEVIPDRRADYRIQLRPDLRGVSLIQRADPDWFYRNDGGRFVREPIAGNPRFQDESGRPLASEPEDFGLAARFYDLTGDGAPELYVANDFEDPDQLWLNDGKGTFRLVSREQLGRTSNSTMAVDMADVDRDGRPDLFQVDMLANDTRRLKTQIPTHTALPKTPGIPADRAQWQRNALLWNRGDGTFTEIADAAGVTASGWSWSTLFLDVDLDGWEDILVGTGHTWDLMDADIQERLKGTLTGTDWREERKFYPRLALPNVAFRNRGDRTFEDASAAWRFGLESGVSHGMAAGDLDLDGDLDVVINRLGSPAAMLRNDAPARRIAVRLAGAAPNTQGVGAVITVRGEGLPAQAREVTLGGLYLSSSEAALTFAAGEAERLTIEVRWRNGTVSRVADAVPGRLYEIREPDAPGSPAPQLPSSPAPGPSIAPLFDDVSAVLGGHRHHDPYYNDYARQPLLPMQLSQLGPGVSWIDVDADGDDDLIVTTGAGGALALFRNEAGNRFTRTSLGTAGAFDLTSAVGLPVEGGTVVLAGQSSYEARTPPEALAAPGVLSFSAGRGRPAPAVTGDTSSVGPLALADLDLDGDLDLFVGGRVAPGVYPVPANSRVFRNDGGRFTLDAPNTAVLRGVGLVSGATFTDVDADGDPDLALAIDWGPVKLFLNEQGRLSDATARLGLDRKPGRWNGIAAGDFDGDGRMDLVATSWGRNLPYQADSARPLLLYAGNFDEGGSVDMLLARHDPRIGAVAPLNTLSLLALAVPGVRERTPTFGAYADAPVDRVIGPAMSRIGILRATTLDHTLFRNHGGRFEAVPLDPEAQLSPAFGVVVADFTGDGHEDLFLAQNFSQTDLGTPRLDQGRGLLLQGDGKGGLTPMPAAASGIRLVGDQRGAAAADFDADGRVDLAVGQNAAETRLFRNRAARRGLRVLLGAGPAQSAAVGATLRIRYEEGLGPAREIRAGSGYWSSDGMTAVVLGLREGAKPVAVVVRWPGGRTTEVPIAEGAREVRLR
ncbi:MAG: VCBS repeat-containing protein [Gemmatimonadales bacterium]